MNKQNWLVTSTLAPIVVAFANYYIGQGKPESWNYENASTVSFFCFFISLLAALILAFTNKSKAIGVWVFSGLVIIFDLVFLILGYTVNNLSF